MKKLLLAAVCTMALGSMAFAQGTFNFANTSGTLSVLSSNGVSYGSTPAALGGFYYQLFIAPAGTANASAFTATTVTATNLAAVGRLNGGTGVSVPGAPAGGTGAIMIRGWSASLGTTYAQALAHLGGDPNSLNSDVVGWFGTSAIALNFLWGGDPGTGIAVPASPGFAGSNGIQTGMQLNYVAPIPEPSSMALAGLGAASLLLFRRRK